MSIISASSFDTGKFKLAVNRLTEADITTFINQREREYLIKLLGAELYALFIADLDDGVPTTAKYVTIFNAGQWDFDVNNPTISNGMLQMLQGIVYYHYVKDNNAYHTITGLVSNNNENSNPEIMEKGAQIITQKYADAMATYDAIQRYIKENLSVYPQFNGVSTSKSAFFY
jgi:hypothetical protein